MKFRVWNVKKERYEKKDLYLNKEGNVNDLNVIGLFTVKLNQQDYKIEYGIEINNIIYYEGDVVEDNVGRKFVLKYAKFPIYTFVFEYVKNLEHYKQYNQLTNCQKPLKILGSATQNKDLLK